MGGGGGGGISCHAENRHGKQNSDEAASTWVSGPYFPLIIGAEAPGRCSLRRPPFCRIVDFVKVFAKVLRNGPNARIDEIRCNIRLRFVITVACLVTRLLAPTFLSDTNRHALVIGTSLSRVAFFSSHRLADRPFCVSDFSTPIST